MPFDTITLRLHHISKYTRGASHFKGKVWWGCEGCCSVYSGRLFDCYACGDLSRVTMFAGN